MPSPSTASKASLALLFLTTASANVVKLASPLSDAYSQSLLNALNSNDLTLADASAIGKALKASPSDVTLPSAPCQLLGTPTSLADVFHAQQVHNTFSCENAPEIDYAKVQKYATSSTDNLPNLYYAISVLRKGKQIAEKRSQIADNLVKAYAASDGSLVSGAFAGMALVEAGGNKLGKFASLKNKIDLVGQMVGGSAEYDFNRIVIENGDLQASSLVVRAIVQLAKSSQEQLLTGNQVLQLANSFLLAEPKNAVETAHQVQALCALNAEMTSLPKPVSIEKSGSYPEVTFKMTNVFGNIVESARFSVKVQGYLEDLDASGVADMTKFDLAAGMHSYEVFVSGANAYAGVTDGASYSLHKPSDAKISLKWIKVQYQKKSSSSYVDIGTNAVTVGDKLQVTFSLDGADDTFQAHQSMIRFSYDVYEGFALAKHSHGEYKATVEVDKAASAVFTGQSGKWNIEALVADTSMAKPIKQSLGSVTLHLPSDLEGENAAQVQATNFSPEKLITHMFPEPEARPPQFLSLVFTALTLSPFLVLLMLWAVIGVNFKLMSLDLATLVFHGAIGCVIGLYVMYWLKYNMFTTIRYLSILGLVLVLSGHRLLSALANRRMAPADEKKNN